MASLSTKDEDTKGDSKPVKETNDAATLSIIETLQKRIDELDEKVKEIMSKETNTKGDGNDDADDSDDNRSTASEKVEDVRLPIGSVPVIKLAPFNANRSTYWAVHHGTVPEYRSSAIVAFYDVPLSRKKDLEESQLAALEPDAVPVRVVINSTHIISLLRSISGTTTPNEPCIVVAPFKLFMHFWDQIKAKLEELKKIFVETYNHTYTAGDNIAKTAVEESVKKGGEESEKKVGVLTEEETAIKAKEEEEEDKDKKRVQIQHWQCLVTFIETHLGSILKLREDVRQRQVQSINFDNMWHLFNPGEVIIGRVAAGQNEWEGYQVFTVTKGRLELKAKDSSSSSDKGKQAVDKMPLKIQAFSLEYDGTTLETCEKTLYIKPYLGSKKINELEFYPKDFHRSLTPPRGTSNMKATTFSGSDVGNLGLDTIKGLASRGLKFLQNRYGHGSCNCITSQGSLEYVESEVFVDFKSGFEDDPKLAEELRRVGQVILPECSNEDTFEAACSQTGCNSCKNAVYLDEQIDIKRADSIREKLLKSMKEDDMEALKIKLERSLKEGTDNLDQNLEQSLLLPRHLLVYALRGKKWHFIDIEDFKPIQVSDEDRTKGFKNLVIDDEYKKLLKAMVNDHTSSMSTEKKAISRAGSSIDIIQGKGRGRIIFLYGPPGVGKTSTAETIAAYTKPPRPLYPITCGDLGSKPEEIQQRLEGHFKLAHRWNCVLLLDEADVYLAERSHNDLDRNGIVSVFLRTLEYYSGILFLTSNREGSIDEAFKSRIHVALRYHKIDRAGTRRIWENILDGIDRENQDPAKKVKVEFNRDQLLKWAEQHFDKMEATATRSQLSFGAEEKLPTWNGRQIRNAFQSALALASYERIDAIHTKKLTEEQAMKKYAAFRRIKLTIKHFEAIADVVKAFEGYLIKCTNASGRLNIEGVRADSYGEQIGQISAYGGFGVNGEAPQRSVNPKTDTAQQSGKKGGRSQGAQRPGQGPVRRPSTLQPGGTNSYNTRNGAGFGVGTPYGDDETESKDYERSGDDYPVGDYDVEDDEEEEGSDNGNEAGEDADDAFDS